MNTRFNAKKARRQTRLVRAASQNEFLVKGLSAARTIIDQYKAALGEYAKDSNWALDPSGAIVWVGEGVTGAEIARKTLSDLAPKTAGGKSNV